jgi:hypothetical protein
MSIQNISSPKHHLKLKQNNKSKPNPNNATLQIERKSYSKVCRGCCANGNIPGGIATKPAVKLNPVDDACSF